MKRTSVIKILTKIIAVHGVSDCTKMDMDGDVVVGERSHGSLFDPSSTPRFNLFVVFRSLRRTAESLHVSIATELCKVL